MKSDILNLTNIKPFEFSFITDYFNGHSTCLCTFDFTLCSGHTRECGPYLSKGTWNLCNLNCAGLKWKSDVLFVVSPYRNNHTI